MDVLTAFERKLNMCEGERCGRRRLYHRVFEVMENKVALRYCIVFGYCLLSRYENTKLP